jgi:mRNA-degrading endonuclease RelE of RelBE toxin-antitoxin system
VATVQFTDEASHQFRSLPRPVQVEFREVLRWLERNPLRPPPWIDQKLLGESKGIKVLRVRVGRWRAIYTFDGHEIRFTRFRIRKDIGYTSLPKT